MADKSVVVRLRAVVSEYNVAMGKAALATDGVSKKAGDFSKLGTSMTQLGGQLTRNVTLPMLAVGAAAGKLAYDFEGTFARMQGLAGVTAEEVDGLKDAVLGLAGDVGRAPQELAEGLYFIRSAGLAGKTAMEALEVSAKGATAGLGSTAAVADAVTSAINAYGEANITAAEAGDVLAATAREGKAEAAALAPQFGRLLPIAAELGVSFQEVGAGMAFLSRSAGDAASSATQLGGVLNKILEPGEEGAKALAAIGSSAEKLRESVDEDGLLSALAELRSSLEANGMSLNDFSQDHQFLQGALQLTGVNAGQAAQVFEALENSTGSLGRAFDAVAETDGFKMRQSMAEVQAALIQIGDVILPLVGQVAAFGAAAVGVFTSLPGPLAQVGAGFAVILAATGPLLKVAGSLATNWKALSGAFETVGLKALYAKDNLGKVGVAAGLAGVVLYGLNKAVQDHARAMDEARRTGRLFSESIIGSDFDVTRVSMEGLTAEITRLSAESDAMSDEVGSGLSIVSEHFKTAQGEVDGTVASLADLAAKATELQGSLGITADEALRLAQDTDFMAAATDAATGALDDEAAAHALVVEQITAQGDALRALFDPLFGAQDAASKWTEARKAVTDAMAANRDDIAENNVSTEEMIRLNGNAVRAALDYQGSLLTLKAAVEDGSVSVEDSIATLQSWVDQSLITQTQADEAAWSISVMGGKADEVDGKNAVIHVSTTGMGETIAALDVLRRRANEQYYVVASISARERAGAEAGGLVSAGRRTRPGPSDTVPMMLAPGEFVMTAAATSRLGIPALEAMNAGGRPMTAGGDVRVQAATGGSTVVHNHYQGDVYASSLEERHLARSVRDAVEAGTRRGIKAA